MYLYLRLAAVLTFLSALAVGVILAAPYDDGGQLDDFMAENCVGECLMGIHPGRTTVGEALAHLRAHLWTSDVRLVAPGNGYGQIGWQWSGEQPTSIDDTHPGRITFYWDDDDTEGPELTDVVVDMVSVYSHIRIFNLENWYGTPSSVTANIRVEQNLRYHVVYNLPRRIVSLSTEIPCPVDWMSYWNAPTRISLIVRRGGSGYVSPFDMVEMC